MNFQKIKENPSWVTMMDIIAQDVPEYRHDFSSVVGLAPLKTGPTDFRMIVRLASLRACHIGLH